MQHRFYVYSLAIVVSLLLSLYQIPASSDVNWITHETMELKNQTVTITSRTPHSPITITSDQNFTDTAQAEGWPGNGSAQSPFIIDSLEIDHGGPTGHCIYIRDTRVNFTISGCHLTGADLGSGILLYNVSYAEISKNNCSTNMNGIWLDSGSSHNSIINNTCKFNEEGIRDFSGHHNTIEDNICESNTQGIWLLAVVWSKVSQNWINNSDWWGIHVDGTDFCSVSNNTCLFSDGAGIRFVFSSGGVIANNTCRNNTWCGIELDGTSNSLITNNTFVNNDYGIYIGGGPSDCEFSWNIVADNRVSNGENTGISSDVFWYNYWSDYGGMDSNGDGIGDTPHILPTIIDSYPLMYNPTPPIWIIAPEDVTIEQKDEIFSALYQAYAPSPITWWVSDGVHFTIDGTGQLISKYFLEAISYNLKIVVSNIYGISISADFAIRVREDVSPNWMIAPHSQTLEFREAFDYYVVASDPSGIAGWILNNTIQFAITEYYYEGGSTARLTNASVLDPGSYALNISVFDAHNNKLSSVFGVIIRQPAADTTSPSWVIASLTETLEFGEPFSKQMSAWDESNIENYWISDTVNFAIDESGLITNATILDVGVYSLEVRAYDPFANYCSATLIITVTPARTAPPSLEPLFAVALAAGVGIGIVAMAAAVFFLKWRSATENS
ncbi:MAG: nitrous oxide reductase family maturation protein NosD [Candidatus Hermodarchaeota archaeon]